ncbi:hypothetical protein LIER_18833 [Lithospermum erythrorhizon]|uniref:Uncharacterized protein n=1 Tax=Lithospermum erythrorhizon TaxID=34254 RepID=A0AAV3QFF6_LITER
MKQLHLTTPVVFSGGKVTICSQIRHQNPQRNSGELQQQMLATQFTTELRYRSVQLRQLWSRSVRSPADKNSGHVVA